MDSAFIILKKLARADAVFYILPLLMVNLVAGTLAERWLGLYAAQKIFFASFIIWAGPIPAPGGYALSAALAFCLTLRLLTEGDWTIRKSGIHLAHFGAITLLFGGLLTALTAQESYMLIPEGETTPYMYDYFQRDLFIFQNDNLAYKIPFGGEFPKTLPFRITLKSSCANCGITTRQNPDAQNARGMARFMQLRPRPADKDPEKNLSGETFEISGPDARQNGLYIAFDAMPKPIELTSGADRYKLIFGKDQRVLPFSIRLDKFTLETYPGEQMAKSYSSDIHVIDGPSDWSARIEMNRPLRYKGYTFYQSSFEQAPDKTATVLAVVQNKGRIFPYIGTALIAIGLLLHVFIKAREKKS